MLVLGDDELRGAAEARRERACKISDRYSCNARVLVTAKSNNVSVQEYDILGSFSTDCTEKLRDCRLVPGMVNTAITNHRQRDGSGDHNPLVSAYAPAMRSPAKSAAEGAATTLYALVSDENEGTVLGDVWYSHAVSRYGAVRY
eukprot:416912-Rhodomonas_salina.3